MSGDTRYEDISGIGYGPERRRLQATVVVKRPTGYGGPLHVAGTREYVRFYVDHGDGWLDAGLAAAEVHDIPRGTDHPLSYVVAVPYDPPHTLGDSPQLPRVRAILSWQSAPPPDRPDWAPFRGARREAYVQILPRRWKLSDLVRWSRPAKLSTDAWTQLGIDLAASAGAVPAGSADVAHEQLECLGLDNNTDTVVGTFRVEPPACPRSGGSTEYVAFWADWGCGFRHLGTVPVLTHELGSVPADGLSYAAVLPVDLSGVRRGHAHPVVGRLRAVLSWGTPPSTTDPDELPRWGNRLDTHVQVRPADQHGGPHLTALGGIPTGKIEQSGPNIGLTKPGAAVLDSGLPVDPVHGRPCPFSGLVTVQGEGLIPGVTEYRLLVRNRTEGTDPTPVTTRFLVEDHGISVWAAPESDGWLTAPAPAANHILGWIQTSGDDLWEVRLEIAGSGTTDAKVFQLDNSRRLAHDGCGAPGERPAPLERVR
jgi:hypothetical protein